MENEAQPQITIDQLAGMMANGFAEMRDQFATLENHIGDLDTHVGNLDARVVSVEKGLKGLSDKVDQLDMKVEAHRQETKDGFAAMRGVMGGMSRTLADHEERIKALEGE
jgi:septal ring factor EnvC (AmiA/AmiB activator)